MSPLTPIGVPITGRPQAMYWMSFSPHLPRLPGVSLSGMMPTSKPCISRTSLSSDQGFTSTGTSGSDTGPEPMVTNRAGPMRQISRNAACTIGRNWAVIGVPIQPTVKTSLSGGGVMGYR